MFQKILNLANYFIIQAKEKPIYMFHGTKKSKWSSIMSSGLIADYKRKNWSGFEDSSFHHPSLSSLGGVYLTDSFRAAADLASNGSNMRDMSNIIVLVVQVQPKSLYLDEDSIETVIYDFQDYPARITEEQACEIYFYTKYPELTDKLDYIKNEYLNHIQNQIESRYPDVHLNLLKRIMQISKEYFNKVIARRISHVDQFAYSEIWDEFTNGTALSSQPPPPKSSVEEGESGYKEFQTQLTKTLKLLADPKYKFNQHVTSGRYPGDLGYAGANKIVAVIELGLRNTNHDYSFKYKMLYPKSAQEMPKEAFNALPISVKDQLV
jgi:hypothetical protein